MTDATPPGSSQAQIHSKLTAYIERMERMLNEIDELKESLKDLKAEIKADGFNVKAVDRVVTIRRSKDAADKEAEFINDVLLYANATGTRLDVVQSDE